MNRFSRQLWVGFLFAVLPLATFAALSPKPTLLGKFVAATVQGEVSYTAGDRILYLKKGDAVPANGTVIETSAHAKAILVFSNQTSVMLEENTRLRIDRFEQEFFLRTSDVKTEPSKSFTAVELLSGRVIVNAPTLWQGSNLVYRTSQAEVAILAERVAISTTDQQTLVAVVSGAAAVRTASARNTSADTGVRLVGGQSIRIGNHVRRSAPSSTNGSPVMQALARVPAMPSSPAVDQTTATLVSTIRTAVAADPASASSIAAKATESTPAEAALIGFTAAKIATTQAPQITFAVTRVLVSSTRFDRSARLKAVSAVAAAIASAAPEQAAFITASAVQALLQTAGAAPSLDERIESISTIAATVAAIVPEAAAEVTSAALAALAQALPGITGLGQQLAVFAARVVAAVARVAPAQSERISVAAVGWVMQNAPNLSASALADAAGLIAAVAAQASPERAAAINAGVASATNLSLMTVQAAAARSTALASQLSQQLGGTLQTAAFAVQQTTNLNAIFSGALPLVGVVSNAVFRPDNGDPAVTPADLPSDTTAGEEPFSPAQIAQLDPALLGNLANDLAATEAAQEQIVFDTDITPNGPPNVLPVPTVPATLPVEFVTSPASGNG